MRAAAIEAGLVQSARAGDIHWRDRLRIITYDHCLRHSLLTSLTSMFSEPEAAAVHCARLTDLHKLRPSQNFMICDAGGGTVVRTLTHLTYAAVGNHGQIGPRLLQDHWADGEPGDC